MNIMKDLIDERVVYNLYKQVSVIQNCYSEKISYIICRSMPVKIFIKNTGEIKYIYDKYTQKIIDKLTNECNKKIKEIIDESDIGKLCNSRGITPYEF